MRCCCCRRCRRRALPPLPTGLLPVTSPSCLPASPLPPEQVRQLLCRAPLIGCASTAPLRPPPPAKRRYINFYASLIKESDNYLVSRRPAGQRCAALCRPPAAQAPAAGDRVGCAAGSLPPCCVRVAGAGVRSTAGRQAPPRPAPWLLSPAAHPPLPILHKHACLGPSPPPCPARSTPWTLWRRWGCWTRRSSCAPRTTERWGWPTATRSKRWGRGRAWRRGEAGSAAGGRRAQPCTAAKRPELPHCTSNLLLRC